MALVVGVIVEGNAHSKVTGGMLLEIVGYRDGVYLGLTQQFLDVVRNFRKRLIGRILKENKCG